MEKTEELQKILELLTSQDTETAYLGYNLLRNSEFKKSLRNKLWTTNGKSFYRFRLFKLNSLYYKNNKIYNYRTYYHNENKLSFAISVVSAALEGKLTIRSLK